jgi:hypothetical protein
MGESCHKTFLLDAMLSGSTACATSLLKRSSANSILERDFDLSAANHYTVGDIAMLDSTEFDIVVGGNSERLINLRRYVGADRYLASKSASDHVDTGLFVAANIAVEWQDYVYPSYPQLRGSFVRFLSTPDPLLDVGRGSLAVIARDPTVPAHHG